MAKDDRYIREVTLDTVDPSKIWIKEGEKLVHPKSQKIKLPVVIDRKTRYAVGLEPSAKGFLGKLKLGTQLWWKGHKPKNPSPVYKKFFEVYGVPYTKIELDLWKDLDSYYKKAEASDKECRENGGRPYNSDMDAPKACIKASEKLSALDKNGYFYLDSQGEMRWCSIVASEHNLWKEFYRFFTIVTDKAGLCMYHGQEYDKKEPEKSIS